MVRSCLWCDVDLTTVYVHVGNRLVWCIGCVAEHLPRFEIIYPDAVLVFGWCQYSLLMADSEEPWLKTEVST